MRHFTRAVLFCLLLSAACAPDPEKELLVKTEAGTVKGYRDGDVLAFTNIPYCRSERFLPPQKPDPWEGVLECTTIPPWAMQYRRDGQYDPKAVSEEGATRLNVWTRSTRGKKPVMVWLHGGGFASGAGYANPNDSGRGLARQDVVLVSVNHRLDILGYLDLSAYGEKYRYSGNVGMLDLVRALEWVRDNISAFGGDPDNVTIFGESGGGGKVGTLLCMPQAKGLFHKAVIMSGTLLNVNNRELSRAYAAALLEELGLTADEVEKLSSVPYPELYEAGHAAVDRITGRRTPGNPLSWGFAPTPDGDALLCQPFQPGFAALSDDIPIIIGTTFNELERNWYSRNPSREEAREVLSGLYGEKADEFMEAFSKAYPEYDTPADMLSVDRTFRPYTAVTADACAQSRKAPLYVYLFAWKSPVRGGVLGSGHGYELPFVFHTTDLNLPHIGEETPSVKDLADRMSGAWVHFAQTGKPAVEGLDWKPYTPTEKAILVFNEECSLRYDFDREIVTLMQEIAPEPVPPVRK